MIVKKPLKTILFQNPFFESGFSRFWVLERDVFVLVGNRYFGEYFLNLLVLNQDLQDFQDYRGRLRFKRKGARRGLLYMLLFAGALRIGEKLGNKSIVYNNLTTQTGDVICSPENPVNPDSKVAASTKMQPCQEKSKRRHPVIITFLPKPTTLWLIL